MLIQELLPNISQRVPLLELVLLDLQVSSLPYREPSDLLLSPFVSNIALYAVVVRAVLLPQVCEVVNIIPRIVHSLLMLLEAFTLLGELHLVNITDITLVLLVII